MSFNAVLLENPTIKVTLDESPELKVKILLLKGDKGDVGLPTDAQVATAVNAFLTAHPEYMTTVADGAITEAKLNSSIFATQAEIDALFE